MELTAQASRVLDRLRHEGLPLRFDVAEICGSGRYRLSVYYPGADGRDVRLGLLYSEDRAALEDLRARLSGA